MDELSEKISELLNDPSALERVRQLASNFMNESKPQETAPDLSGIMSAVSAVKNAGQSDDEKLLAALKPHLSAERREKADKAIKILRLVSVLPLLRDSGLIDI